MTGSVAFVPEWLGLFIQRRNARFSIKRCSLSKSELLSLLVDIPRSSIFRAIEIGAGGLMVIDVMKEEGIRPGKGTKLEAVGDCRSNVRILRVGVGTFSPRRKLYRRCPRWYEHFRAQKQNAPDSVMSHGAYVDQPSPKCCSRRRLRYDPVFVNG